MSKYIAVDAGKAATKVAIYDATTKKTRKIVFQTKIAEGDFRDDAIEENTFVAEIEGKVYKIGNGARGEGAVMETSKQSEVHRICTLAAIGLAIGEDDDKVYVATGLPATEWAVVEKREAYKEYIFPKKSITIKIKESANEAAYSRTFKVEKGFVFPESIGAHFQDDSPEITPSTICGVLDLGSLNLNATFWEGTNLILDDSITSELGANVLAQGLAQELSANFSRCNERLALSILRKRPECRHLATDNEDVKKQSQSLIADYLLNHAKRIKRCCDAKQWPLDFMSLVAIGGLSATLENEFKEVFNGNIHFLQNPAFANAFGFLRMMCVRLPEINDVIPLEVDEA